MKALLEVGGRSPGGTRRRWRTAGEGHRTVPGQLADRWPSEDKMQPDLERISLLMDMLGSPQKSYPVVVKNGKLLRAAGAGRPADAHPRRGSEPGRGPAHAR